MGIPMLPARLVEQMRRMERDSMPAPLDVVVIAPDYDSAASLRLPWANVVAIVAESSHYSLSERGVPTVLGVHGLLTSVEDDQLVLVDADRGLVLTDPDGTTVALYQAEKEKIAPRRRVFLDYEHQYARSLDGREIRVHALVATVDEIGSAVMNGADSVAVQLHDRLMPNGMHEEDQHTLLCSLAEAASGKPITLLADPSLLSCHALLKACLRAEFTLGISLGTSGEGLEPVYSRLHQVREELISAEEDFGDVRIAACFAPGSPLPDELADLGISRVMVLNTDETSFAETYEREWLESLGLAAAGLLLPLEVAVSEIRPERIEQILGLGASGLLTSPSEIQSVKNSVRCLNVSAYRSAR
jgi:hypothetical protein